MGIVGGSPVELFSDKHRGHALTGMQGRKDVETQGAVSRASRQNGQPRIREKLRGGKNIALPDW